MLLARLFESLPLVCPNCGADMRIVAFITETDPVRRILTHIGEPAEPPRIAPARGPPAWDDPPADPVPDWEALAQPSPEHVFDQAVQWQPPSGSPPVSDAPLPTPRPRQTAPHARSTPSDGLPQCDLIPVRPVVSVGSRAALATPFPPMLLCAPIQPPMRLDFLSLSLNVVVNAQSSNAPPGRWPRRWSLHAPWRRCTSRRSARPWDRRHPSAGRAGNRRRWSGSLAPRRPLHG